MIPDNIFIYLNGLFANKKEKTAKFVIFGRGRSGSTLLQSLLNSVPNIYCEQQEIFKETPLFPCVFLKGRYNQSNKDVYGFKILTYQFQLYSQRTQKSFLNYLIKNDFKIIYLIRNNLLMHAISNIRAREMYFHNETGQVKPFQEIQINKESLLHWLIGSESQKKFEKELLYGIPHLKVTYEEYLEVTENHQNTVNLICQYLGINNVIAKSRLKKVSPRKLEDSISNYNEIKNYLLNTRFRDYL